MEESDKLLECEKPKKAKSELWNYISFMWYPIIMFLVTIFTDEKDISIKTACLNLLCVIIWVAAELRELILKDK